MKNNVFTAVSKNQLTKFAVCELLASVIFLITVLMRPEQGTMLTLFIYALPIALVGYYPAVHAIERLFAKRFSPAIMLIAGVLLLYLSGAYESAVVTAVLYGACNVALIYAQERLSRYYIAAVGEPVFEVVSGGERCRRRAVELKVGDMVFAARGDFLPFDGKTKSESVYAGVCRLERAEIKITALYDLSVDFERAAAGNEECAGELALIRRIRRFLPIAGAVLAIAAALIFKFALPGMGVGSAHYGVFFAAVLCVLSCADAVTGGLFEYFALRSLSGARQGKYDGIKNLVVNKNRILTRGTYAVSEVVCAEGYSEEQILSLCAAVQNDPTCGFAKAFFEKIGGILPDKMYPSETVKGMGLSADIGGMRVFVGSAELMKQCGADISQLADCNVYVAVNGSAIGGVRLSDRLKGSAIKAMKAIRGRGVRTFIVSNDSERTTASVAAACGASGYRACCADYGKAAFVDELRASGATAYFGDDEEALKAADIAISCDGGDYDYLPEDGLSSLLESGEAERAALPARFFGARLLAGAAVAVALLILTAATVITAAEFWVIALVQAVAIAAPPLILSSKTDREHSEI